MSINPGNTHDLLNYVDIVDLCHRLFVTYICHSYVIHSR